MLEFKVTTTNPVTGKETVEYELFPSFEAAVQFDSMHTNSHVDFDSMIDWAHGEHKYEYEA